MKYHCRAAVGHFSRLLSETDRRQQQAATAALAWMWLHAPDPYATQATIYIDKSELATIVGPRSVRRILTLLADIEAIDECESMGGSKYKLRKPSINALDVFAHMLVTASPNALV